MTQLESRPASLSSRQSEPLLLSSHHSPRSGEWDKLRGKDEGHLSQDKTRITWQSGPSMDKPSQQLSISNTTREPRKVICSKSKLSALGNLALFHLPAISITLVLVVLNLIELQWPYGHPTSEEFNALQFAAKAHESFIIMSVVDILLHRISYGLLCGEIGGVSLGFLSSPFHLASPVQYLVSWEFWGTVSNPGRNRRFHAITTCLILLLVLIGVAASPFSAILMIPRLGWWQPGDGGVMLYSGATYVKLDAKDPYPNELVSQTALSKDYCEWSFIGSAMCDQPNIRPMIEGVLSPHDDLVPLAPFYHNISFCRYGFLTPDRTITYTMYSTEYRKSQFHYWTAATAPMAFATLPLLNDAFYNSPETSNWLVRSRPDPSSGMNTWKQPLVAVSCSESADSLSGNEDSVEFQFNTSFPGRFSVDVDLKAELASLNDTQLDEGEQYYQPEPIFLDLQSQVPIPISAMIMFVGKVTSLKEDIQSVDSKPRLCLVQARWASADIWLEGQSLPAVKSELGMTLESIPSFLEQNSSSETVIKMHGSWLSGIENRTAGRNSSYRQGLDICNKAAYSNTSLHTFLAVYLTDALSLLYSLDFAADLQSVPDDGSHLAIEQTLYTYQYAYTFRNGTTILIAMVVLLLHVVIALSHTGIIIFSSTPWASSGWGSFGQLMALALRSRGIEGLGNVGAGVASSQTWKREVSVRDLVDENRLEMVLGAGGSGSEDRAEKEGEDRRRMRNVKPGAKYS
ncbi:hypothetical protein QQZ08_000461 [Neonectria magnoliae]|uniref:Uncharacterized protein n=1 Tax=Neonectria magnoliae TaxID=2732573 RepID=A0ABR1IH78_9HYPO